MENGVKSNARPDSHSNDVDCLASSESVRIEFSLCLSEIISDAVLALRL